MCSRDYNQYALTAQRRNPGACGQLVTMLQMSRANIWLSHRCQEARKELQPMRGDTALLSACLSPLLSSTVALWTHSQNASVCMGRAQIACSLGLRTHKGFNIRNILAEPQYKQAVWRFSAKIILSAFASWSILELIFFSCFFLIPFLLQRTLSRNSKWEPWDFFSDLALLRSL